MKVYTVERVDQFDYAFSVEMKKYGAFKNRKDAIQKAKEVFDSMCSEYEDKMFIYSDEDTYGEGFGRLDIVKDHVFGYYKISFGDKHYECHSVAVEEWEMGE